MCRGVIATRCSSPRDFTWLALVTPFMILLGWGLDLQGGDDSTFVSGVRVSVCISFKCDGPIWESEEPDAEGPVLIELVDPIPVVSNDTLADSSCDSDPG